MPLVQRPMARFLDHSEMEASLQQGSFFSAPRIPQGLCHWSSLNAIHADLATKTGFSVEYASIFRSRTVSDFARVRVELDGR